MATLACNKTAMQSLLQHLEDSRSYKLLDLLDLMEKEGFSDAEVKQAVVHLLHEQRILLTTDRQLRSSIAA